MRLSDQVKIKTFDKYIMRGGDQSLQNIEDLCDFGFNMCQLGYDPEQFNDVVIDVICKLIEKLEVTKWPNSTHLKDFMLM